MSLKSPMVSFALVGATFDVSANATQLTVGFSPDRVVKS